MGLRWLLIFAALLLALGCDSRGLPGFADPPDPDAGPQLDEDAGEELSDAEAR